MTQEKSHQIAVLGAGSWGTALAIVLQNNGHDVSLWEFRPDAARQLDEERENKEFLPGITIPKEISISSDPDQVLADKSMVVFVVPSHVLREVSKKVTNCKPARNVVAVSAVKGIENESLMRMSEILLDEISWLDENRVAALSGPSHAEEVSRNIPTAVVAASKKESTAQAVQQNFMNKTFRVYDSTDIVGVELGGAVKNIIAIAAGICDGAGFGDNTKAALQPRALVEIVRLGTRLNANPMTFAGLSGMGDLIVTCMSKHSRNRYLGEQIGSGKTLQDILKEMTMVAEGVNTTRSVHTLSHKCGVEMPISNQVYEILFNNKDPKQALHDLMIRDAKKEAWG